MRTGSDGVVLHVEYAVSPCLALRFASSVELQRFAEAVQAAVAQLDPAGACMGRPL